MASAPENSTEKSQQNSALLKKVLQDPLAEYWSKSEYKPNVITEVARDSLEFDSVESLFEPTARGLIKISRLERIENPFLLGQYLLKKQKLEEINGSVDEKDLFHGTHLTSIPNICKFNFDWRKSGQAKGHKFGRGVSFAPEVSYARHYTQDKVMILSKVLVCRKIYGGFSTVVPPEPYDTTTNGKDTVFVKYEDDDFYPQYIIHFKYFFED